MEAKNRFENLKPYQKRSFVPKDIDLTDPRQVAAIYNQLLNRQVDSADALEKFILDRSELEAVIDQYSSIVYIEMTCQTDDKKKSQAYKHYIDSIVPAIKPLNAKLDRKYIELNEKFPLDKNKYEVYNRNIKTDIELFRQENVSLQKQEDVLSQQYQSICGAMMVKFQGKEYTMPQIQTFLENTDSTVRENAWRACTERYLDDAEKLDELFDKMLILRRQIAANAGYDNYRDYKFVEKHRFDYTVDDCKKFHDAVEKYVVPVIGEIYEKRKSQMNLQSLCPWDLKVDAQGRQPLRPFEKTEEYTAKCQSIFSSIDRDLGNQFQEMIDLGLLDLASRKGKAPGGYQAALAEARRTFIFGNTVGIDYDVYLLLHEAGHAFHSIACRQQPLFAYRHAPYEFCEVASMSMEMLGLKYLDVFYNRNDCQRSLRKHLESVIIILAWVAAIDAFQHWIYENPDHSTEQRCKEWVKIHNRFGSKYIDWSGLELQQQHFWHKQIHVFQYPFYYIEYGIAQLGALGIWLQSLEDPNQAVKNYRKALLLGGSRPLPELFKAANLEFDFSDKTIEPLVNAVAQKLDEQFV